MPTRSTPVWSSPRGVGVLACTVAAVVSVTRSCPGQCETAWAHFPGGGTDNAPYCLLAFDADGSGPAPSSLLVGGSFYEAGGVAATKLARWTGSEWSGVGGGTSNDVYDMAPFDEDGPGPDPPVLYVCGSFTSAGGVPANRIARWDGSSWLALGVGLDEAALSMAVFDEDGDGPAPPALFVGGAFAAAGGAPASRIARWNGSAWSAVGTGFGGTAPTVATLTVFDDDGPGPIAPALYAGGGFTTAGPVVVNKVARWDGTAWAGLGSGLSHPEPSVTGVNVLAVFDEDGPGPGLPGLFVGGLFQTAGGIDAP